MTKQTTINQRFQSLKFVLTKPGFCCNTHTHTHTHTTLFSKFKQSYKSYFSWEGSMKSLLQFKQLLFRDLSLKDHVKRLFSSLSNTSKQLVKITRATKVAKALKTKKMVKMAKVAVQAAKKAKVAKMAKVAVYTLLLFHFSLSATFALNMTDVGTYTGSATISSDSNTGYWKIKFLTSGTFIPVANLTIDAFLVGGGGGGRVNYASGKVSGGGGYTLTKKILALTKGSSYPIVIGAGGTGGVNYTVGATNGGSSTFFGFTAGGGYAGTTTGDPNYYAFGGNGGSGGSGTVSGGVNGGSDGSNGNVDYINAYSRAGTGQGTTTREFGEATGDLYAGGGGASRAGVTGYGGAGGGGTNGPGAANTGGGGGSSDGDGLNGQGIGYNGGSGIVVIRGLLSGIDLTPPTCGTWTPATASWTKAASQSFALANSTDNSNGSGINVAGGSCSVTTNGGTCNVTISDKAGNTKVCTSPAAKIDRTAPVCGTWTQSLTDATATMTLANSTDTGGSLIKVAGGNCTVTVHGNNCNVSISDNATNTTTCTSPAAIIDLNAPSGGSITYTAINLTKTNSTLSLTVNDGTDDNGINVASRRLERREATMDSEGVCSTTYSNYYPVTFSGTYPSITTSDFEIAKCYQYQWLVSDNADNQARYVSNTIVTTIPETLSFNSLPLGTIVAANNLLFAKVNTEGLLLSLNNFPNTFSTTFNYTGNAQSYTVPETGWYQIELWGAQGGTSGIYVGGLGGYTSGKIFLTAGETIYPYIGASNNVFNGGGNGGSYGAKGGGATDVRLVNGDWSNATSLNSRLIVAAGGAGAGSRGSGYGDGNGGAAGGLIGSMGQYVNVTTSYGSYPGYGGTQIAGGGIYAYNNTAGLSTANDEIGSFGLGGGNKYVGGGGGYYGGGGKAHAGGGGGSSFISGYAGVNAIASSTDTANPRAHTNQTLHYSKKYFIDGQMQAGVRSGNGQAKITFIPTPKRINVNLNNVRYIKDCVSGNSVNTSDHWVELQALKNGVNVAKNKIVTGTAAISTTIGTKNYNSITDGNISSSYAMANANGLQCVVVDLKQPYDLDEIAVWHYWADNRSYNSNTTAVSADNSTWTTIIDGVMPETANGKRVSAYQESHQSGYVNTDLLLYYDGVSNSSGTATTWKDLSGNNHTSATLSGGSWGANYRQQTSAAISTGLDAAGTFSIASDFTLSTCFKINSVPYTNTTYGDIGVIFGAFSYNGYGFYWRSSATNAFSIGAGMRSTDSIANADIFSTINSYDPIYCLDHVYSSSAGTFKVYNKGVLTKNINTISSGTFNSAIGEIGLNKNQIFSGNSTTNFADISYYNAKIYNRALTETEIKHNYQVDRARFGF